MRNGMLAVCGLAAGLLWVGSASAQQIVHALSGTVTKVDPQAKTIQIKTNDGSEGVFSFPAQKGATEVSFDRDVKGRTTPVSSFDKTNEEVVVYYYGNDSVRTAVAVQELGTGPFDTVEGTVTKFNRKQHDLSVKDASGKEWDFTIDPKAMADSMMGAVPGDRFSPSKGDNVRVIATKAKGAETALFIRD
jgi:hypothetical protein